MAHQRIAFLADLHSNLEALDACLEHAHENGATRFVFLGDIVGYNADPVAVIDKVKSMVDQGQAIAIQGNHDVACFEDYSIKLNPVAL